MLAAMKVLGAQVVEIWKRFGINQKASIVLAFLAVLAAVGGLLYWSSMPDFRLLYSGLTLADASMMREKLEDAKIPVKVGDSGRALYVPAAHVYDAKLMLAGEGLPKEGASGFELFEQPKFGLTDFAQRVNYQRALQGELERTIASLNGIQAARVTLVLPKEKLFATEEEKRAQASIMLTLAPGATLPAQQVRSITHLVASAVPGLKADGVTVVDQDGRLLSAAASADEDQMVNAGEQLNIQKNMETQLTRKVQEMLDAFLGEKRSVVRVAVELDFSRVQKWSERYDKDGKVVKEEKILAESSTRPGGPIGVPGTVANVPVQNPANPTLDQATAKTKKENIQTEYLYPRGQEAVLQTGARVKRLSVSVCVAKGEVPRTEAERGAIADLVKGAVGYVNDPAIGREDAVQVQEMEFKSVGGESASAWWQRLPVGLDTLGRWAMMLGLLLIVFVVARRIMSAARIEGAEVGVPVRAVATQQPEMIAQGKEVDVDLYETLQAVKEDPKKAAAWITRALEIS